MSSEPQSGFHQFWTLIKDSPFPVITTRRSGDALHSRPVVMCNRNEDSVEFLWFLMPRSSEPVEDMQWDSAVSLVFAPQEGPSYIAVFGSAVVIEDVDFKRQLWSSMQEWFPDGPAWFPSGVGDSSTALVRIKVISADCWDTARNTVTRLFTLHPTASNQNRPSSPKQALHAVSKPSD